MRLDIDNIPRYVINLDKREDRLRQFESEIKHPFPDGSFIRQKAFEDARKPFVGCAKSHLEVIRKAREEKAPHVLIMEDDVVFQAKERTRSHLLWLMEEVPDDFGLLFGGVYQSRNTKKHCDRWNVIKDYSSTHFYVVPERSYDIILEKYDPKMHIDRWYAVSGLKSYAPDLMFAIQSPGFSDNVGKKVDYSYFFGHFKLKLL